MRRTLRSGRIETIHWWDFSPTYGNKGPTPFPVGSVREEGLLLAVVKGYNKALEVIALGEGKKAWMVNSMGIRFQNREGPS
jgi:hypothetical protein